MIHENQLKPCPFCGSIPHMLEEPGSVDGPGGYLVECPKWGCVTSKGGLTINITIDKWNTRSQDYKQFSGYSTETPKGDV